MQTYTQAQVKLFRERLFAVENKIKKTKPAKKVNNGVDGVPRAWLDKSTKLARELEHYRQVDTASGIYATLSTTASGRDLAHNCQSRCM